MIQIVEINRIQSARLLTLRSGLGLEVKGLKKHGRSCYSIIKEEFKLKGNKASVHEQFTGLLVEAGILV